jgi:hypothetical protein
MKRYQLTIFVLITLHFAFCPAALAQIKAGYIILNSADTLYGVLALQSDLGYSTHCLFKNAGDDTFKKYTPETIREFRFIDGRKFISAASLGIEDMETKGFLEFLVNGRFSTYVYYQPDLNTRFFGRIDSEDVFELKNTSSVIKTELGTKYDFERKEYIGILNYKLQDYPDTRQINNLALNTRSLIRLAVDYHQYTCPDIECVVYVAEKRNPTIRLGFISNFPLMSVKAPWETNLTVSSNPGFGLSVNLSNFPEISNKVSLQAEVLYSKQQYEFVSNVYKSNLTNEVFAISALRIPLVFKYTFNAAPFKPFLGAGTSLSIREIEYASHTDASYLLFMASKGFLQQGNRIPTQLGLNFQAGANLNINRYFSIEYAAIVERNPRFFSTTSTNDRSYSDQLIHCIYIWYKI